MELGDRKRKILKAVIDDYIASAEPVGSKAVAEQSGLDISTATIRNEMAELESMGYLEQPHTSAGRVPSPLGYRLYVDELMRRHELTTREIAEINGALTVKLQELDRIVSDAGRLIARFTNYTSYSVTSRADSPSVKRYELFPADPRTIIAVIVTDAGIVRNTTLRLPWETDEHALHTTSAMLNAHLTNLPVNEITPELLEETGLLRGENAVLVPLVMSFVATIMEEFDRREVYLTGTSKLLSHPEYHDILKAQRLLEFLSDSGELSRLPAPDPDSPVQVLIGPENIAEQLRDASVVMTSYPIGGNMRGLIGVVGPTRMDYAKVVSRLGYFAERLGRLLSEEPMED